MTVFGTTGNPLAATGRWGEPDNQCHASHWFGFADRVWTERLCALQTRQRPHCSLHYVGDWVRRYLRKDDHHTQ